MNLIETITAERDKLNTVLDILNATVAPKRKRGRPKGSKNRDALKPVVDAIVKAKPHWTQTPEGRAKQRRRALKAYRTGTGFSKKGGRK